MTEAELRSLVAAGERFFEVKAGARHTSTSTSFCTAEARRSSTGPEDHLRRRRWIVALSVARAWLTR